MLSVAMNTMIYTMTSMPALRQLIQSVIRPDVIDFWLQQFKPTWSVQQGLATIIGREQTCVNTITFFLRPNRHVPIFQAGQHLNVTVQIDGVRMTRSYSPSRRMTHPQDIAISIKKTEGGIVSTWFHTQAKIGDVIQLDHVFGEMTLPVMDQPLLLLAAGSGITPMISLLRATYQQARQRLAPMRLLYWVRTPADICFLDELQQYAAQDDQFEFHIFLTQGHSTKVSTGQGRIDTVQLAHTVPDIEQYLAYVCGSTGFVQAAQTLIAHRVKSIKVEAFSPPQIATGFQAETVQITLRQQNRVLTIAKDQPLLPALEGQGVRPAYGCRMGICNTCVCRKVEGSTAHILDGVVQHEPTHALKLCVNTARTDLILDL
jgi:stearoyl-CoA 9-desaturase NADPH oxidoreductase